MRMPEADDHAIKGGNAPDLKAAISQMVAPGREGAPRRPARARGRPAPRSRTSSPAGACSSSSTASSPTSCSTILQSESDGMAPRHAANAKVFATAGGFAPTIGILGTVMGLVHVLENLADPAALGHSIAGAFLATLYGVGSANLVYLPIATASRSSRRTSRPTARCCSRAILSIQAGDNPRMLAREARDLPPAGAARRRPEERQASRRAAGAAAPGRVSERHGPRPPPPAQRDARHDEHADERWLLTYADMITLLMALFIVMWAMSSVNISKFDGAVEVAEGGLRRRGHRGRRRRPQRRQGDPAVRGRAVQPTDEHSTPRTRL